MTGELTLVWELVQVFQSSIHRMALTECACVDVSINTTSIAVADFYTN
jgi:hypothetical protein